MKHRPPAVLVAAFALLTGVLPDVSLAETVPAPRPLAIVNVNVVDTRHGTIAREQAILIEAGRITRVVPANRAGVPAAGWHRIDARGKYAIPGLWDMHVHSMLTERDPDWIFPLLIANGVTGIRDMGTFVPLVKMLRLREDVRAGRRPGPRMVLAGPLLDGFNTLWSDNLGIPDPREAIAAVRLLKDQGADFVKIFPLLPRATYFAIVEEARRLGVPIAGQVPDSVRTAEAAAAGQRGIDHLEKIVLGCSAAEDEIVADREEVLRDRELRQHVELRTEAEERRMLETYDPARCAALLRTLAEHRVRVVPTLVGERAYHPDLQRHDDPRLVHVPAIVRDAWRLMDAQAHLAPASRVLVAKAIAEASRGLVRPLGLAGVPILAGSHTSTVTPFVFPGFGLHDELQALVDSGLDAAAALRAATLEPARFLDAEARFGTIAAGRAADLVLLDADPLADISNTRRIHAVITAGRLYERKDLEALLARASNHQ